MNPVTQPLPDATPQAGAASIDAASPDAVSPVSSGLVQLRDLSFRWKPDAPLILDIEKLSVPEAAKVFIKGASGSGKTTLLNLIAGVIRSETGSVKVGNANLSELSGAERDVFRADNIGFIFQMFNLIPYLSVLENVTVALMFSRRRREQLRGAAEDEARRILERLGLNETLLGRNIKELSIGQQQRVAAARAIIGNPPLLIADEPTSALDTDTRERFIELLFEECDRAGTTLLFVSHDGTLEHLFDAAIALKTINRAAS